MCHFRRVNETYKRCGHAVNLPQEEIVCENRSCKFSDAHPRTCGPPGCLTTCWQWHQAPQSYFVVKDNLCPDCMRQGRR